MKQALKCHFNHVLLVNTCNYSVYQYVGTKFRRVSSNKDRTRSASTGNILGSSPPSYPDVATYNAPLHSLANRRPKIHRNSSSSQGDFCNQLHSVGEAVGFSGYSINEATSLDSVNHGEYERHSTPQQMPYAHHTHSLSRAVADRLRENKGISVPYQHKRHSLPPSQPSHVTPRQGAPLGSHSSRESFLSGREGSGLYVRQPHLRDSMSQDMMGEREFDYQYRYNLNNSTTLPTLSLQDSYQRENSGSSHGGRQERGRGSVDRDLRRDIQEFDVMPIHEAFAHEAMTGSSAQAHISPMPPNQTPPPEGSSRGGTALFDQASNVESQPKQLLQDDTPKMTSSDIQQQVPLPQTYYPVFFSPESGQMYMRVDGSYKPVRNPYYDITDGGLGAPRESQYNQVT